MQDNNNHVREQQDKERLDNIDLRMVDLLVLENYNYMSNLQLNSLNIGLDYYKVYMLDLKPIEVNNKINQVRNIVLLCQHHKHN